MRRNISALVRCKDPRNLHVARYLRDADVILHAGDVCTADVLDELSGYALVQVLLACATDRPPPPAARHDRPPARREPAASRGAHHPPDG